MLQTAQNEAQTQVQTEEDQNGFIFLGLYRRPFFYLAQDSCVWNCACFLLVSMEKKPSCVGVDFHLTQYPFFRNLCLFYAFLVGKNRLVLAFIFSGHKTRLRL